MLLSLIGCNGNPSTVETGTAASQTEQTIESSSSEETASEESTEVATATATPEPTPEPTADPAEGKYLKDLFAEHGMKVGTCLTGSMISRADSNNLILSHFNSVTCENAMKPDATLSQKKSQEEGNLVVELVSDVLKVASRSSKGCNCCRELLHGSACLL